MAIFLPIVFVQDEAGQLFRDIAIAVSCSVVLSLLVAISVIPSLANQILSRKKETTAGSLERLGKRVRDSIANSVYQISDNTAMRLSVVILLVGISLGIAWTASWPGT